MLSSTPQVFLPLVWPVPRSLATTCGISFDFFSSPYLDVSVQAVPPVNLCIQLTVTEYCSAGFPHSDIHGSKPAFGSPWLFADRCVLLRLLVPRHPPCALFSLTIINYSCSSQSIPFFLASSAVLHCSVFKVLGLLVVGSSGLEPPTLRLSGARSNHLSYEPMCSELSVYVLPPGPFLVEMRRFELLTPCVQGRCSPS